MTLKEWEKHNNGKPLNEWARIPDEVNYIYVPENGIVMIDESVYELTSLGKDEYIKILEKEINDYKDKISKMQDVIAEGTKPISKQAKKVEKCATKLFSELTMLEVMCK